MASSAISVILGGPWFKGNLALGWHHSGNGVTATYMSVSYLPVAYAVVTQ